MIVLFTGILKRVVSSVAPEVCTSTITHKYVVAVVHDYIMFVTRYEWQCSLIHTLDASTFNSALGL